MGEMRRVSARLKRTINYVTAAVVTIGLAYLVFVPVAPDRIDYSTTTGGTSTADTYFLTKTVATIGRSADISIPRGAIVPAVAATLTAAPDGSGAFKWSVASVDASVVATVDGRPAAGVTLSNGAVIDVTGVKFAYSTGRAGLLGFLDRIESNSVLHLFISPAIMSGAFSVVLAAMPVSLAVGVLSFIFAIPLGLGLAFMKMARTRWARWPATLYVDVVRGTPLFLQILIIFFGIPLLPFYKDIVAANPWMSQAGPFNVTYTEYFRGLAILSLNSAAYMAEIFRAGIQSIPKGQMEAARSLGMSTPKAMAFVIIPQTVRRILPTMMSEFILLFKDTALLAAVGVAEMVMRAREVAATKFNTSPYVLAAMFYLVITIPLGRFVQNLEDRLAVSEGTGGKKRAPMVPEPIDSEHIVPHKNLMPSDRLNGGAGRGGGR
jgi:polar amino acid transport system substrate-binding protein